ASEKLEKARTIMVKLNLQNSSMWGHLLENLGDLHRAQGRFDQSEKELLESLELRKKRFKEDLHGSYHDLAKLYRDKHDWKTARLYFEKALSYREKRLPAPAAETLKEFAKMYEHMGNDAEATVLKKRADELLERAKQECSHE